MKECGQKDGWCAEGRKESYPAAVQFSVTHLRGNASPRISDSTKARALPYLRNSVALRPKGSRRASVHAYIMNAHSAQVSSSWKSQLMSEILHLKLSSSLRLGQHIRGYESVTIFSLCYIFILTRHTLLVISDVALPSFHILTVAVH
jgi:hypothetical protein